MLQFDYKTILYRYFILTELIYLKMSIRNNSNNTSTVSRTKCCKVCKDAGEPENVYSSHYVKDREGNVTCPKLKAIVCLNCGKRGHTSSYCKAPSAKIVAEKTKKLSEPVVSKQSTKGKFDCLFEDDSDDEKPVMQKITHINKKTSLTKQNESSKQTQVSYIDDFPTLSEHDGKTSNTATCISVMKTLSYANMVAKPIEPKIVKQTVEVPSIIVKPAVVEPVRTYLKASEMDWAMEDSDSDSV